MAFAFEASDPCCGPVVAEKSSSACLFVEHDGQVGQLLKKLDDLGIANNTIVIYTTDNGAETFNLVERCIGPAATRGSRVPFAHLGTRK
jgi:arylsulfatase A-like enzyme